MASTNSWNQRRVLFLTALALALFLTFANAAYTGLRYGKRESTETIGRLFPRSSGVRNIQSRSSGTRFYPGTRFGGKRAYWNPSAPILSELAENPDSPPSNFPYDCVHVPFIGLRCSRVEENYWNNNNNDEDQMLTNDAVDSDGSGSQSLVAGSVSAGGGP